MNFVNNLVKGVSMFGKAAYCLTIIPQMVSFFLWIVFIFLIWERIRMYRRVNQAKQELQTALKDESKKKGDTQNEQATK